MQVIPIAQNHHDLIGISPTGSGKTAAFLIPMIQYISTLPKIQQITSLDGPYGLIIAPTRELAQQISKEAEKLADGTDVRIFCIVGGHDIEQQSMKLQNVFEIVIATPGRLLSCLEQAYISLNQCCWLVIDEADKIFTLGQDEQLRQIFNYFDNNNQFVMNMQQGRRVTQLFSATMNKQVKQFWSAHLYQPYVVTVGDPGAMSQQITQNVYIVKEFEKRRLLGKLMSTINPPVIIFVNTKAAIEPLVQYLQQFRLRVGSLHGEKKQQVRERTVSLFQDQKLDILVTTNLGSRGLDFNDIQHVINFDAPYTIEDYEHRIGRTGRMGKSGQASTFLTEADFEFFIPLRTFLERNNQIVPNELRKYTKSLMLEELVNK